VCLCFFNAACAHMHGPPPTLIIPFCSPTSTRQSRSACTIEDTSKHRHCTAARVHPQRMALPPGLLAPLPSSPAPCRPACMTPGLATPVCSSRRPVVAALPPRPPSWPMPASWRLKADAWPEVAAGRWRRNEQGQRRLTLPPQPTGAGSRRWSHLPSFTHLHV
jgi:hypothetical protein